LASELNVVVLKACAADARSRYSEAGQMQSDLEALQQGKSVRQRYRTRRRLALAWKLAFAALFLCALVAAVSGLRKSSGETYDTSRYPEVDRLVEQGLFKLKSGIPERVDQAKLDFEAAIKRDPTFFPAWYGLFKAADIAFEWNWDKTEEQHQHFRSLAAKLMELDPQRAEAHTAAACVNWMDWEFADALKEDRKAITLRAACRDGRGNAHGAYGFHLLQTGDPDGAEEQYQIAENVNPTSPTQLHHRGHPYFVRRQFDKAMHYYAESVRLDPQYGIGHQWVGRVYLETNNFLEALKEFAIEDELRGRTNRAEIQKTLREAVLAAPADPARAYWGKYLELALERKSPNSYSIATVYARLGEKSNALFYLTQACKSKAISEGPLFDPCWDHSDTNFLAIVKSYGWLQPPLRRK
jgi:tetratricopeptide (TPR) repeat protein